MFGIGETLSCVYGGQGYRNGVREGHLKTAEGFIGYPAPQAAGTSRSARELRGHLKGHSEALEAA